MKRVFFLGAGASKAAGMPLTNELTAGVAYSLLSKEDPREERISDYLLKVHQVERTHLEAGYHYWKTTYVDRGTGASKPSKAPISQLPSIIYILSLIDVFLSEDCVVYDRAREHYPKQVDRRELDRIRERSIQCIAHAFDEISETIQPPAWLVNFVRSLSSTDDTLITTNWDILLDKAAVKRTVNREKFRFPHTAIDYGTNALCVDLYGGNDLICASPGDALALYKLHGSFGWLYCQRCSNLYCNPEVPIATLGFGGPRPNTKSDADLCDCRTKLFSLLVTPTFLKSYNNRHLGNVWASALQRLTQADEWHFVGYSLPSDDLHIRSLLIKGLGMRQRPPMVHFSNRASDTAAQAAFEKEVFSVFGRKNVTFDYAGAKTYLECLQPTSRSK